MNGQMKRIEYEKDFHNRRIKDQTSTSRDSQSKYYFGSEKYAERLSEIILENARDKVILELGCFGGQRLLQYAGLSKYAYGVDLSDESVQQIQRAIALNRINNCSVFCADAHKLPFPNESLDLIYGFGILHHLDFEKAVLEVKRVLRPYGKAFFMEPLGTNPLINLYRRYTPNVRSPYEKPLTAQNLAFLSQAFRRVEYEYYGGLSILSGLFGAGNVARYLRQFLNVVDDGLFRLDALRRLAWCVNIGVVKGS